MPKQTNTNTVFLHAQSEARTLFQIESLKSSQWKLLKWPLVQCLKKNADPGAFIIIIIIIIIIVVVVVIIEHILFITLLTIKSLAMLTMLTIKIIKLLLLLLLFIVTLVPCLALAH